MQWALSPNKLNVIPPVHTKVNSIGLVLLCTKIFWVKVKKDVFYGYLDGGQASNQLPTTPVPS